MIEQLIRMSAALLSAFLIYQMIWIIWFVFQKERFSFQRFHRCKRNMISTPKGLLILISAWVVAFSVYAGIIETAGKPFTMYWLNEVILKGDWIPILLFSIILSFSMQYFVKKNMRAES